MKKALSLLVAALFVMGWSGVSEAKNYYATGNIGLVWFDDADFLSNDIEDRGEDVDDLIRVLFDSGITLTGAIGCDLGDVRGEFEMGYQVNDAIEAQEVDIEDGDVEEREDEITGDVSLVTFMFNGYYDIPLDDSGVELFLTAGVGSAFWRFDEVGDSDEWAEERVTENGSTWAYQFGAGVSVPVGDDIRVEARYRYFNTAEFTTADDSDFFEDLWDEDGEDPMNGDIASHSILVGLRYNF